MIMTYKDIFQKTCTTKTGATLAKVYNIKSYLSSLAKGEKVHLLYWSRSCRFCSLCGVSHQDDLRFYLSAFGVKYETGNDSPKNGMTGNYTAVPDGREKAKIKRIIKLIEENNK